MNAMDDTEVVTPEKTACSSQANGSDSVEESEVMEGCLEEEASLDMSNGIHSVDDGAAEAPANGQIEENGASNPSEDGNVVYENGFLDHNEDNPVENPLWPESPAPAGNFDSSFDAPAESRSFEESSSGSTSSSNESHSENPTSSPFRDSSSVVDPQISPSDSLRRKEEQENESLNDSNTDSDLDTSFEKSSDDGDESKEKLDESFTSEMGQNEVKSDAELEIPDQPAANSMNDYDTFRAAKEERKIVHYSDSEDSEDGEKRDRLGATDVLNNSELNTSSSFEAEKYSRSPSPIANAESPENDASDSEDEKRDHLEATDVLNHSELNTSGDFEADKICRSPSPIANAESPENDDSEDEKRDHLEATDVLNNSEINASDSFEDKICRSPSPTANAENQINDASDIEDDDKRDVLNNSELNASGNFETLQNSHPPSPIANAEVPVVPDEISSQPGRGECSPEMNNSELNSSVEEFEPTAKSPSPPPTDDVDTNSCDVTRDQTDSVFEEIESSVAHIDDTRVVADAEEEEEGGIPVNECMESADLIDVERTYQVSDVELIRASDGVIPNDDSEELKNCSPEHRTEQFRLEEGEMINEPAEECMDAETAESADMIDDADFAVRHPDTPEPRQPEPIADSVDRCLPSQVPSDEDVDPSALTIDTGRWSNEPSPKDQSSRNFRFPTPSDDEDSGVLTIDTSKFDKVAKRKPSPKNAHIKLIIRNDRKEKKFSVRTRKKGPRRVEATPSTPPAAPLVPAAPATPPSTNTISSDLKCPRCPASSFSTVATLLAHQRVCGSVPATRRVYRCSSCSKQMEMCELFHHMKEKHRRHICLHCLVLFTQASKLAQHMIEQHHAIDVAVQSGADYARDYPGPYSLLCAKCGLKCTVNDFENHFCSRVCSHCGMEGTHYPTCRLAPPPTLKQKKERVKGAQRATKKQQKQQKTRPKATAPATESQELTLETSQTTEPSGPLEFSPTTYHEKMMELYRAVNYGKQQEKPLPNARFSTAESIEDSINRVLEAVQSPERSYASPKTTIPESPEPVAEAPPSPPLKVESPVAEPPQTPTPAPVQSPLHYTKKRLLSEHDSSDSGGGKLTIELKPRRSKKTLKTIEPQHQPQTWTELLNDELQDSMPVAGEETPFTCVPLQEPLNRARVPTAMKLFLRATAHTCVYCAHARKIAVNAKQLALHQLSQHRYVTLPESASVAEKNACHAAAVKVMKEAIPALEDAYFNAYGFDSTDKSAWRSADRTYECFHCNISTPDLREFNQHNRKLHSNDMRTKRRTETHLCIMCKTRFLTYSELLCHLCRGVYVSGQIIDPNVRYRCYCCDIDPLPSSFRLMVHLRLNHTTCDMCFAVCDSQYALQTHVMGHKAIHYCYACALTYDSRQELSKHIFWKHGAESATCKRCDRKKWKHAYHFCLPPAFFTCPECKQEVKSALALRVHSRIHQGVLPHACTECSQKFISRKLLDKHTAKVHAEFVPEDPVPAVNGGSPHHVPSLDDGTKKGKKDKKKDLRELFDLPPVNLSESDDSSDDEKPPKQIEDGEILEEPKEEAPQHVESDTKEAILDPEPEPAAAPDPVVGWYGVLASLEGASKPSIYPPDSPFFNLPADRVIAIATRDHDYCRPTEIKETIGNDHDYCNNSTTNNTHTNTTPKHNSPRKQAKRRNRSSSSDSSSSSSSSRCPTNCSCTSCSSSTSSTESASSGEQKPKESPRKKKLLTKAERKKGKAGTPKSQETPEPRAEVQEIKIRESDLETDEPITDDEEFYELNPALRASQVLQHNRSILLDKLDAVNPVSTPPVASTSSTLSQPKRKKNKKGRTMGGIGKIRMARPYTSSPYSVMTPQPPQATYDDLNDTDEHDGRRPRRKRVPQKYYGFTSDDDDDGSPHVRKRKRRIEVEHNTTIPASPPRPGPAPPEPEPSNLWNPPSWRAPPIAPKVNPIKIRTGSLKQTFAKSNNSDEFHIKRAELGGFHVNGAESSNGTKNEKLYCYCHCPYDEVSEMIACDAVDCRIEWFHFECVNIMDPPKGKWFCPECLKKKAAESEMMGIPFR